MRTRRLARSLLLLGCVAAVGSCSGEPTGGTDTEKELAEIRAALAPYRDGAGAVAAGYTASKFCVTGASSGRPATDGDMGVHYTHHGLYGRTGSAPPYEGTDAVVDPKRPEILLYEPQPNGSMELVGAEYMVSEKAWKAAGHASPPSIMGYQFDLVQDNPATAADEARGYAPYYDLHFWTERPSPRGLTAPFNPMVSCSKAAQP